MDPAASSNAASARRLRNASGRTRTAAGRPCRVIVISSPSSTRDRSSGRAARASETVIDAMTELYIVVRKSTTVSRLGGERQQQVAVGMCMRNPAGASYGAGGAERADEDHEERFLYHDFDGIADRTTSLCLCAAAVLLAGPVAAGQARPGTAWPAPGDLRCVAGGYQRHAAAVVRGGLPRRAAVRGGGAAGTILSTGDGGATWRTQASPLQGSSTILYRITCVAPSSRHVIARPDTILVTHDGGAT